MQKINRTAFFSILVVLAFILSACSGAAVGQSTNDQSSSGQAQNVVFTGTVDSMGGGQWTISGQAISVDSSTSVDANVTVGDNVKVEARVGSDGSVTALSIETSSADNANTNTNSNDANQNDSNANGNASNSNDNQGDNSNAGNDNGNGNSNSNDNSNPANDQEVSGAVEAITTDSITIGGVVYKLADFTEFKSLITLGDNVKIHVIVNADGTFTIREIEKFDKTGVDNGNSNSNSNGSDDNSNVNSNSNSDDHGGNSNDNKGNDNSNDKGNDNGGNDNSNSNGNGNG
ncbi:MAG: DUF5666 domain-containing protein [Chloroflexota bacterium]